MISTRALEVGAAGLGLLVAEAQAEGYRFLNALEEELGGGLFGGPGEVLLGCFEDEELIGLGALTRDPFLGDQGVGRIRRVYVRAPWRNQGVGRMLVEKLVEDARKGHRAVRLRAENADAARMYERMGFRPMQDANASHEMNF